MLDSIQRSGQPVIDFGRRCPKMDRQLLTPLPGHNVHPQIEILTPNTSGRISETAPGALRMYGDAWMIGTTASPQLGASHAPRGERSTSGDAGRKSSRVDHQ